MKRVAILGSTGSIGQSALKVAYHLKDEIEIVALAAHSNEMLLVEQIREFSPRIVSIFDEEKAKRLRALFPSLEVVSGHAGVCKVAACNDADMVLSAIVGTAGLKPTIAAIMAGKDIALANKEVLISAGEYVMGLVKKMGVQLIPVDSEHSAIFQCLRGNDPESVSKLILTASGGPFLNKSDQELEEATLSSALKHPNWKMGPKITIDSSTLMNKGLEVIEASWLFDMPLSKIDVVIHPESVIHSMVEYVDGSIMAQLGAHDMIIPIQYALTYPTRKPGFLKPFDFIQCRKLQFAEVDYHRFRCLRLAFDALREGKSMPCYMNGANEVLVQRFMNEELKWKQIGEHLEELMSKYSAVPVHSLEEILEVDQLARLDAKAI